jgi:hypothetical protein
MQALPIVLGGAGVVVAVLALVFALVALSRERTTPDVTLNVVRELQAAYKAHPTPEGRRLIVVAKGAFKRARLAELEAKRRQGEDHAS